ncbi:Primosome PriB/single-strand DNA-binding [Penicillium camemberti]|uniref:Primosome PriB/single-strand DNA-binding n=1 Tax=Penicillium camemberti (strain FM 013) TaxID=1429867 RepID=A0A0G4PRG1_PENC3|nr:Primosome PriB/single-strand DNA-binding [Penicillium camemberti]
MSAFLSSLRPAMRMANVPQTARAFSSSPANSIARLTLTGRLGAEPELHATSSGQEIVRYNIATTHGNRENRQTSWWRVTNFVPEGSQRDFVLGLQKGTVVFVEADAKMVTWEDGDGNSRSTLNVVQRTLEVLKRPDHGSDESR